MGRISLIGLGPGALKHQTVAAQKAMEAADILCGYTVYIDLVREQYPDKAYVTTPMTQELERCRSALELAQSGKHVAMLCSGDAGIYGMAGPVLSMLEQYPSVESEIIPGVTAAISGAAVLGAPLMNDFCVISLSDLLTPWNVIEKRLRCAAEGDFCISIYNPMSRKREKHLSRACEILLEYRAEDTVCGWVQNIGREEQKSRILSLAELKEEKLDMFTTVFVGCESTIEMNGHMITMRGYGKKHSI